MLSLPQGGSFPMVKTSLLVTFCAHACRRVVFIAGFAVVGFGSSAQAQFGVPGGIAPFSNPGAAGALAADCYYQWKGRGGGQLQCPAPAQPAPSKDHPDAKK